MLNISFKIALMMDHGCGTLFLNVHLSQQSWLAAAEFKVSAATRGMNANDGRVADPAQTTRNVFFFFNMVQIVNDCFLEIVWEVVNVCYL
uniref:Uncharacterized protein n=1 Tax=Lynx canadensis TaxID=61383 RepID=A0A667G857_LYNCA